MNLKKLQRDPPLVRMPKAKELLHAHPFIGALPEEDRFPFESSTKEIIKMRGITLYKESSKPNGIWLISNGVVKVCQNTNGSISSIFLFEAT